MRKSPTGRCPSEDSASQSTFSRVKPLKDYASTSEMLKATVAGEFFECHRRLPTLLSAPYSCLSRSSSEKKTQAAVPARIAFGLERPNVPPGWIAE
jgi:hypothetical protein